MHPAQRVRVDEAVIAYINFIRIDNAPRHVENKISMLRRFIGSERTEKIAQSAKPAPVARRFKTDYRGDEYLHWVKVRISCLIDKSPVSRYPSFYD